MKAAMAIGVSEPRCTTFGGASKWLFPGMETLVSLQLATLNKGFSTVWKITDIRPFTAVGSFVSLKRLLARENAVANITANWGVRVLSFFHQNVQHISSRSPPWRYHIRWFRGELVYRRSFRCSRGLRWRWWHEIVCWCCRRRPNDDRSSLVLLRVELLGDISKLWNRP